MEHNQDPGDSNSFICLSQSGSSHQASNRQPDFDFGGNEINRVDCSATIEFKRNQHEILKASKTIQKERKLRHKEVTQMRKSMDQVKVIEEVLGPELSLKTTRAQRRECEHRTGLKWIQVYKWVFDHK